MYSLHNSVFSLFSVYFNDNITKKKKINVGEIQMIYLMRIMKKIK